MASSSASGHQAGAAADNGERDVVVMVSSDCHASPKQELYRDLVEQKYLPDLEDFLASQTHWMAGLRMKAATVERTPEELEAIEAERQARDIFATDLKSRLGPLDADGFVSEVLFPDGGADNEIPFSALFGTPGEYGFEQHAAALRAYNRWMNETGTKERQVGLALIPLYDPEYARLEASRVRSDIIRGVMPSWDGAGLEWPSLFDASLDPFWAECAAQGLPVHFHVGQGVTRRYGRYETLASRPYVYDNEFWCRRPLWHLVLGGVLERHPDLVVVFTETKTDWIPRTLTYLDWEWERGKITDLPNPPSFYFERQILLGATTPSLNEQALRHELGSEKHMYGTDFPHASSPWGVSTEFLQATLPASGYTETEARRFLGLKCAEVYGIDVEALLPVAQQIGPTIDEILATDPDPDPLEVLAKKNPNLRRTVDRPLSLL